MGRDPRLRDLVLARVPHPRRLATAMSEWIVFPIYPLEGWDNGRWWLD
jgi:hypothetical protein